MTLRRRHVRPEWHAARLVPHAILIGLLMGTLSCAENEPVLELIDHRAEHLTYSNQGEVLPLRPYMDDFGLLHWGGGQSTMSQSECNREELANTQIWMESPRIEEVRCFGLDRRQRVALLLHYSEARAPAWRYSLSSNESLPGNGTHDERVAAVDSDIVLLDSLRVIEVKTGRVHTLLDGKRGTNRARVDGAVAWKRGLIVGSTPGGGDSSAETLYALHLPDSAQQPLARLPWKGPWSHWVVRDLALSDDARWLYVALQEEWRGPSELALAVLDMRTRTWVQLDAVCEARKCQDPRIIVGHGMVGFAYQDWSGARTVLRRYRHRATVSNAN